MSASVDAELHAMTRFLLDASYDLSFLGSKDEHFLEELQRKVDGVKAELDDMVDRVRRGMPVLEER